MSILYLCLKCIYMSQVHCYAFSNSMFSSDSSICFYDLFTKFYTSKLGLPFIYLYIFFLLDLITLIPIHNSLLTYSYLQNNLPSDYDCHFFLYSLINHLHLTCTAT